jgi:hypothetical protein
MKLKNNNGAIKGFLIAIVVFTMMIAGAVMFYSDVASNYNYSANLTTFNNTYNAIARTGLGNLTRYMGNQVQGSNAGFLDTSLLVANGVWQALLMPFQILPVIGTMLSDFAYTFHIPVYVVDGMIILLGLMIIFAVIAAVFRWML